MEIPEIPQNENSRLAALQSFAILDTLSEGIYDNLTKLASEICGTPIALISLIDENRQWFKSRFGLGMPENPRDISFCGHAINFDSEIFEIADTSADRRFADNPLVTGDLKAIYYAGAPLKTSQGFNVGTLCVIDHQPRKLNESQKRLLRLLADQVVMLIEMRGQSDTASKSVQRVGERAEAVSQDWFKLQSIFAESKIGLALLKAADLIFEKINREFERLVEPRAYLNRAWSDVYRDIDNFPRPIVLLKVMETGTPHIIQEAELSVINSQGVAEQRFYDFKYTRILGPTGKPYGILIQCLNVTHEVQARQRLMQQRNVFQTTLTSIGDAVISVSADPIPKIQFLNPVAEQLTGWSASEAIGLPVNQVFNVINAKTRAVAFDPIGKVLRTGQTQGLANHTALISRLAQEYIIEDSAAPIKSNEDEVTGVVLVFRDITKKHATDERMLLLNALIEQSKDFVAIFDPSGRAIYSNPSGRKLIGLRDTDEIKQTNLIDYFTSTERSKIQDQVLPVIVKDGFCDGRVMFENFETHEAIPMAWSAFSIPETETGGIAAIACIARDLREMENREHEIKMSRALLERKEEQLSLVVAVSGVGFYDWKISDDSLQLNDQFLNLFRVGAGATLAQVRDQIHPDDRKRVRTRVEGAIANHTVYIEEYRLKFSDNGEIWLRSQGRAFYDSDGVAQRFVGTVTDITKQRLSEENLRNILNNMPHFAVLLDREGEIRLVNQTAAVLMQKHPEDFVGMRLDQLQVWTDQAAKATMAQSLLDAANGKTTRIDIACTVLIDGQPTELWVDSFTAPLFDSHGNVTGILNTGADVTARKKLERELADAKDEADRANSAKSAFLANMSHEIRSPLGAIMGFSDLMRNQTLTHKELLNFVSIIDRNSKHLLRVVDDILDLAKVEAGKMLIERLEFSLPELLADFASLMGLRAREKGIDFELRVSTLLPDFVISDPTRLRQILNNVVGNALKFTEKGEVKLSAAYADKQIVFSVSDTGPGISSEQINKLFRPFQQADVSTTRKYGGTGLGLVLTRKLAEALDGSFHLKKSIVGQGSVFVASIAVDLPKNAKLVPTKSLEYVTDQSSAILMESKKLEGMKVLVVDDSSDNQFLFEFMLKQLGAEVDIAADGFEAVNQALANPYDIILMDVQMPRMDGHEATRALRQKQYTGPIIALTAHAMKEERERAKTSGFTDFLSKPVNREALVDMLERFK